MRDLLFHVPWWMPLLLALAGAVVFVRANSRQQWSTRRYGMVLVALAGAWALVSYLVDTPLETCTARTRLLISSFKGRDWTTFRSILDPQTSLSAVGVPVYGDRQQIVDNAKVAQDQYNFRTLRIIATDAQQQQAAITVYLTLYSEQDLTLGRPFLSKWQFDWAQGPDGWMLLHITALQIAEEPADRLIPRFPGR